MPRTTIINYCWHCGKDFPMACVGGLTICPDCKDKGHTDFTMRDVSQNCVKCIEEYNA